MPTDTYCTAVDDHPPHDWAGGHCPGQAAPPDEYTAAGYPVDGNDLDPWVALGEGLRTTAELIRGELARALRQLADRLDPHRP